MKKNKPRSKKKLPKGRERYIPTQEEVERRNAEISRKPFKEESEVESEAESEGGSVYVTDSQAQSSENEKDTAKKNKENSKKEEIINDEKDNINEYN
ncbi:conserved Plasmodium protein, unknown function [Plasmodium malariae]|uniref:Uncharacterized protein n=1 Tax=Plasmodium malariae TaxID=5858 RepID=A0A1A8X458_PLAMA|nr:conserved Plasmodium protein, unknown function [Plasmodium malariae]SBT00022.1 conserved Plasmodium protein, unknown function [Plasmodium malariae]SCN44595.1 conserved Plasmodium protein, unknown function [Plasmodium malariae]